MSKFSDAVHKWMRSVDALEVNIEGQQVSVLMHKNHADYQIFIDGWLNNKISTERFKEFLEGRYWWVGYPLNVFRREVFRP